MLCSSTANNDEGNGSTLQFNSDVVPNDYLKETSATLGATKLLFINLFYLYYLSVTPLPTTPNVPSNSSLNEKTQFTQTNVSNSLNVFMDNNVSSQKSNAMVIQNCECIESELFPER